MDIELTTEERRAAARYNMDEARKYLELETGSDDADTARTARGLIERALILLGCQDAEEKAEPEQVGHDGLISKYYTKKNRECYIRVRDLLKENLGHELFTVDDVCARLSLPRGTVSPLLSKMYANGDADRVKEGSFYYYEYAEKEPPVLDHRTRDGKAKARLAKFFADHSGETMSRKEIKERHKINAYTLSKALKKFVGDGLLEQTFQGQTELYTWKGGDA